ncbi:lipoyl-dependent peroxiredoxin [Pararobbsia alpina]
MGCNRRNDLLSSAHADNLIGACVETVCFQRWPYREACHFNTMKATPQTETDIPSETRSRRHSLIGKGFQMDNEELKPPPMSLLDRYRGQRFLPLYTTTVTISGGEAGHGRASGIACSNDGNLSVNLRLPKEFGGPGDGTNPEQLFAAGFGACFHGVLSLIAKRESIDASAATVETEISFGRDPADGGYALVIEVRVRMPGVERRIAEELVRTAERFCPYTKMAQQGSVNIVTVVD